VRTVTGAALFGTTFLLVPNVCRPADDLGPLPGTRALHMTGDLSDQMIEGINRFLDGELAASPLRRSARWNPDYSSAPAYEKSVRENRDRFRQMIGLVDQRLTPIDLEYVSSPTMPAKVAETETFTCWSVKWPVFGGIEAEGLLLEPKRPLIARVIALTDADQTPEVIAGLQLELSPEHQYARRLAESGCQVLIPTLANRADDFSGSDRLQRFTNQPHREWIQRQAFVLGRHIIGYEVQKVLAGMDWLERQNSTRRVPLGLVGWGEGGLLAFHTGAVDTRIDATLVSGYFDRRERVCDEPIYRNLFGQLNEFGDAELAQLIVPRRLVIEHARGPVIDGPPHPQRRHAAPGRIDTPARADVRAEFERARQLARSFENALELLAPSSGAFEPLGDATLRVFLSRLTNREVGMEPPGPAPVDQRTNYDGKLRQRRAVDQMVRFTQRQLQFSTEEREAFFWKNVTPTTAESWGEEVRPLRDRFWSEFVGRLPSAGTPPNPRARLIRDGPTWRGFEVVLDLLPEIYAWGYYLLPKNIRPGEQRPVVVAQHGLMGVPADLLNDDPSSKTYSTYKAFAVRLVERGFIVFVPHIPLRGGDRSKMIQRKANPLGKTLYSVIVAQHDAVLDWLATQPNVDPARMGFYGLSYGGKTAMRVGALLERYKVVICSGDFNEMAWKNATTDWWRSFMYTGDYEMPEFRQGITFGYAEMAALICPRPFMVERGHNDGVGLDEWVAFEYAKVNRLYNKLKIPHLTEIEYFDGPHTIYGVGAYRFLHRHLGWPEPTASR
jgi:dienelactone hydrolase